MIPDHAWRLLMRLEGAGTMTDDPLDPGGLTRYGIAKRFNPDVDVAALTEQSAREIYAKRYWVPAACNLLPHSLALVCFDTAVHAGVNAAREFLQRALGVAVDGRIGPATVGAAKACHQPDVILRMLQLRADRLLSRDDAAEERFERGWIARLLTVAVEAMTLTEGPRA